MYKDDSFHSTKFSTDRGYATSLDMNIYLWKEDIKNEMFYNADWSGVNISEFIGILNDYLYWYNEKRIKKSLGYLSPIEYRHRLGLVT